GRAPADNGSPRPVPAARAPTPQPRRPGFVCRGPEAARPSLLPRMRDGDPPVVEAYDREGSRRIATGTLLTIDNSIDPSTGTVKVKAQFPNEDDALFPNQFVNARLLLDVRRGATIVPGAAVRR